MQRRDFTRAFGKQYDGPRLRNPLFATRTVSKAARIGVRVVIVAVVVGLPALFVYAPFMRYDTIHANGLTTLHADDVTGVARIALGHRRFLVVPGTHIFFANLDRTAAELDARFHFEELVLRREGFRTLVIDAKERITEIAWTVAGKTYFVDLTGVAARDATPEALATIAARRAHSADVPAAPGVQPTMPIIDVRAGGEVALGSTVIAADRLAHILALDDALRSRGLAPISYTLDTPTTPWLTVSVLAQPSLLVDITVNPDNALLMYDAFVHDRGDVTNLEYIDLRFGDHVYSKER